MLVDRRLFQELIRAKAVERVVLIPSSGRPARVRLQAVMLSGEIRDLAAPAAKGRVPAPRELTLESALSLLANSGLQVRTLTASN